MNMKTSLIFAAVVSSISSIAMADDTSRIADLEKRLQDLDQKYRILERRVELDQENAVEKSKSAPVVSIGANGVNFRSADTNFFLKVKGLLQFDSHTYIGDNGIKNNDSFLLRRVRPIILEGTIFRDFDFGFVPEFGGSGTAITPTILDAYLNYRYSPELQLQVGKFKNPISLEQLQSDSAAFWIERSLPAYLAPNRDLGVELHGDIFDSLLSYQLGIFNGSVDNGGSTSNKDFDDEKEFNGRVFVHPFVKTSIEPLQGLGLGVGSSYGRESGTGSVASGYTTEAGQTFFSYNPKAIAGTTPVVAADGLHWRLAPQGYYYWGPFGLLGEYVISSQHLSLAGPTAATSGSRAFKNKAWQVSGSYVLTGENAGFKGVTPKNRFSLSDHHWGAFEAVGRYSSFDVDDNVFNPTLPFANAASSATGARAWTLGLNWYLNQNVRASVDFTHTDFKGGTSQLLQKNENAVLTRVQLSY
ncbi:MAG: oprP [Verrucomicrobiales bacterium]|nr:oprP [Verrucomicrobiales bacterium]